MTVTAGAAVKVCVVRGCERRARTAARCEMHYSRRGTPSAELLISEVFGPARGIVITEAGRAYLRAALPIGTTVRVAWEGVPLCCCGAMSGSAHRHWKAN